MKVIDGPDRRKRDGVRVLLKEERDKKLGMKLMTGIEIKS